MNGILAPIILLTAISVTPRQPASDTSNALKAIGKATYIQTGLNKYISQFEKKHVPKELREYGSWATTITKAIVEQKVTYEWTF